MPFHTNQLGLGKRHWNLETTSAVVEFPPPYHLKMAGCYNFRRICKYIEIYVVFSSGACNTRQTPHRQPQTSTPSKSGQRGSVMSSSSSVGDTRRTPNCQLQTSAQLSARFTPSKSSRRGLEMSSSSGIGDTQSPQTSNRQPQISAQSVSASGV